MSCRPTKSFLLRMPVQTQKKLSLAARQEQRSLNAYLNDLLAAHLYDSSPSWKQALIRMSKELFPQQLLGLLVYGSTLRNEHFNQASDIDIAIVLDKTVPLKRTLYRKLDQATEKVGLPHKFSLVLIQEARLDKIHQQSLWIELALNSKILYEKQHALSELLFKLREKLFFQKHTLKSNLSHGQRYWANTHEE